MSDTLSIETKAVFDRMLRVSALRPGDWPALAAAAAEDRHQLTSATEVIWRGAEIVGAANLTSVPTLDVWLHSAKTRSRENLHVWNTLENVAHRLGARTLLVPCAAGSPFSEQLAGLGYRKLPTEFWTRDL